MPAEAAVRFESALRQIYDERGDGQRLAVKLWDGLGHVSDLCPCPPPNRAGQSRKISKC